MEGLIMKSRKQKPAIRKEIVKYKESENAVPSPRWVRRRIYRNLSAAAVCGVNVRRKRRSEELLAITEVESKNASSKEARKSPAKTTMAGAIPSAPCVIDSSVPNAPQPAGNRFKQYIRRVSNFVRGKLPPKSGHNRPKKQQQATRWLTGRDGL